MRNLVSVQQVNGVVPIPDADKIEVVEVLGWKLVVKKGEFKPGDKVVYFEVDSFLPVEEKYEFLRASSFKRHPVLGEGFLIKTIKLRGQISQGLALSLESLGIDDMPIGTDMTEKLRVRKWEPIETVSDFGVMRSGLPDGVSETDETRIQSIYEKVMPEFKNLHFYITTKIDGTSITMYRKNGVFGCCSHKNEILNTAPSFIWDYAIKHNIEQKMVESRLDNYAIQGEMAGPGIQKNRLNLIKPEWYVFTIIDLSSGRRLDLVSMRDICKRMRINMVPVEQTGYDLGNQFPTLDSLLERAKGKYSSGKNKEGIVIRPTVPLYSKAVGGWLSFKVLNNDYLLKEK